MDELKHVSGNAQQVVIVALPSENDPVLKFSSDKEPHLTLLYLGSPGYDASELALVTGFVEHAASLLQPFGLEVKERGVLGASHADVLFFNKKWTKAVDTFRGQLLKNELISKAFLSTSQFDEWNPHLTMGFPDNPAKKDDREFPGFSWVSFNRIALWTSDSAGPTFKLEYSTDMEEVPVSQADLGRAAVDDVLEHFGVKGMKWGVRKDQGHSGERAKTKKIAKLDSKFQRNSQSLSTTIKLHNRAAELTNKDIDRINNKLQYKNADFTKNSPLRQKYYAEHQKAFLDNLKKAADELGTNASGTKKYSIVDKGDSWDVSVQDVKHASGDTESFSVNVSYDSMGHIVKLDVLDDALAQREKFVDDFLEHFGVKGMRWGVRGGKGSPTAHPSSEDAQRISESQAKVKSGGTKALSTKELQELVTRLNSEQQFDRLGPSTGKKAATKFITDTLVNIGKQELTKAASGIAAKQVAGLLKK